MERELLRLYPTADKPRPLAGTYLAHDLPGRSPDAGFLYTNFITTLDGRISEVDTHSRRRQVPRAVANERDWRLFLELAAQADALLTTGRHLRALAAGRHTGAIRLDSHPDLVQWRQDRGLPRYPALVAVSESLDIPVTAVQRHYQGPLFAAVSEAAPPSKVGRLEDQGMEVIRAGQGPALSGGALRMALERRGWQRIYSIAGPRVAHSLLQEHALDRLYLTVATLALGGRDFDTLALGNQLVPPARFSLTELYLDTFAPGAASQLFAVLDAEPGDAPR